jgi:hypothetical protein
MKSKNLRTKRKESIAVCLSSYISPLPRKRRRECLTSNGSLELKIFGFNVLSFALQSA